MNGKITMISDPICHDYKYHLDENRQLWDLILPLPQDYIFYIYDNP